MAPVCLVVGTTVDLKRLVLIIELGPRFLHRAQLRPQVVEEMSPVGVDLTSHLCPT